MLNLLQVSIIIEYTRRDYYESIRIISHSQKSHLLFRILAIVVFFIASMYLFLSFDPILSPLIPDYLILPLYLLGLFLWFDYSWYFSARSAFKNYQKQGIDNIVMAINSDGIFSKSNLAESHSSWKPFIKTFENVELFLLVMESKNFLIFPKRFFSSREDIISFRKLAKAKVGEYERIR